MRKPDNELFFRDNKLITLNPYIRVNDTQTMLKLALDGLGIVKLHHYLVKDHLAQETLVEVLHDYNDSEIPIYVAYPERRYITSKTRCFIDFILDKINETL